MTFFCKAIASAPLALLLTFGFAGCGEKKEDAKAEAGHAGGDHAGEEEKGGAHEEGGDRIVIPADSLKASGVSIAEAGPRPIRETLLLTGRVALQPAARAEIHAPYPGPVRAILKNVGDLVRRGETLARVESAESLQTYAITSPIAGIVLDRQSSVGDVTHADPLFVVGDLTRLQVELNVAARDFGRINAGQAVIVTGLDGAAPLEARIATVLPAADARSQTLIARAPLSASSETLRPGMAVRGQVVVSETQAPIGVPADSIQTLEGRNVVFARVAPDTFEARPVSLGRAGPDTVEITAGLKAGESYVASGAFLMKAEIGNGAASHDH